MFVPIPAWELATTFTLMGSLIVFFAFRAEKQRKKGHQILYLGGFFFLALGVVAAMSYLV